MSTARANSFPWFPFPNRMFASIVWYFSADILDALIWHYVTTFPSIHLLARCQCLIMHGYRQQSSISFSSHWCLVLIPAPKEFLTLQAGADWGKKVVRELLSDRPTQYTARGPLSTQRAAHSIHGYYTNKMILAIVTLQGRYSLLDEYA